MQKEDYISLSLDKLKQTIEQFKMDTLDSQGKTIINLLKGIMVVEKQSATPISIYNQLKESYFQSDLATAHFICSLYGYEPNTMDMYLDICLEQVFEDEIDMNVIKDRVNKLRGLMRSISSELEASLNQKLQKYQLEFKL